MKNISRHVPAVESNNNIKEFENVAELELVIYLREKPVLVNLDSEEGNTDLLEWWKDNSYQYKLSTLAKFLCVPATSAPSERLFSCTRNIS